MISTSQGSFRAQTLDRRHQLHPVVRGVRIEPKELLLDASQPENASPSTRPGIAETRPVRDERDLLHAFEVAVSSGPAKLHSITEFQGVGFRSGNIKLLNAHNIWNWSCRAICKSTSCPSRSAQFRGTRMIEHNLLGGRSATLDARTRFKGPRATHIPSAPRPLPAAEIQTAPLLIWPDCRWLPMAIGRAKRLRGSITNTEKR